jgi:membrane protein YqaA with SNARE-associated domain
MRRLLAWIQGFAESLGGPGLFVIAYLDSSFLSFPQVCDALIVLLTVRHPERMLFYSLVTTLGSVAGCYSLYLVGRKGGETFLRKRFHERHVDNALAVFRRHGILSVLVPSLLPPPMPFKIFVLAAGVAGMRSFDFLVAVALGRSARYFGIGLLAWWKGQQALAWIQQNSGKAGLLLSIAILLGATVYFWWKKRRRGRPALSTADPGPDRAGGA